MNQGPRPNLLPKLAISAESEGDETSGLGDPSKTSLSIAELPQDEHDATTPGSTHSGATLSGLNITLLLYYTVEIQLQLTMRSFIVKGKDLCLFNVTCSVWDICTN